jgi:hypothetical protein
MTLNKIPSDYYLPQDAVQNSVTGFVSYTMALLSGIGDTILSALLLSYDSLIAVFMGMAWGIQNIMYAFNPTTCRVSDYMQKLVLRCACGDTPYMIPQPQRAHDWTHGALWCSGALTMTLLDGTQGVIYNPYSLDALTNGLGGLAEYLHCLSVVPASTSATTCKPPSNMGTLSALSNQNVQPIAVWAKCKTNYLLQTWDPGAGALFFADDLTPTTASISTSSAVMEKRAAARKWARDWSPDLLACLESPARFNLDYTLCMTLYLNLTTQRRPNAYYLYAPAAAPTTAQTYAASSSSSTNHEPPDACLVFSGLNASSSSSASSGGGAGNRLSATLRECMLDSSEGKPADCPFNPSIWSASSPANTPVAKLFGTTVSDTAVIESRYDTLQKGIKDAFEQLNRTFQSTAKRMKIELFSADGDFIHDFIDCVFLGPYTRVDMLPCDLDGRLECPFYARCACPTPLILMLMMLHQTTQNICAKTLKSHTF